VKHTGIIGLGNMGLPMARNLLKTGYSVHVYDINSDRMDILSAEGAAALDSPQQVAQKSEVIVLSLPNIPILEAVIAGPGGLLELDLHGKTIIDTTTATMEVAKELAAKVARQGGIFLDSPVTGGAVGAANGTLNIMVGGDQSAFDQHIDVFEALGSNVVYIGESGHGQVSKLVNQLMMGAIYCSVSESFAFASHLGVDVARVYQAVEFGGAKSGLLSGMKHRILSGQYGGKNYLAQHGKDIDYAMDEANRHHSFMPIASAVHEVWNLARNKGYGSLDSHSIFAVWEDILGKKLNETISEQPPGVRQ
jgi:2-hydroxy-3-oxopropionate reductase